MARSPFRPEEYDAVLSDMDGVLIYGGVAAPGAKELIARAGEVLYLVTNESAHTPESLSSTLAGKGVSIPPERILLAGAQAVDDLTKVSGNPRVLIRGDGPLHDMARHAGVTLCAPGDPTDIVLLGRDPEFDMPALEAVTCAIEDGAELWVTNDDPRHPIEGGRYTYQTGAILASVLACTGDVPVRIAGKPQPGMFLEALQRAGADPAKSIMLGDNPATDGAGAAAAGLPVIILGAAEGARARDIESLLAD